jgi:hypothetical protein
MTRACLARTTQAPNRSGTKGSCSEKFARPARHPCQSRLPIATRDNLVGYAPQRPAAYVWHSVSSAVHTSAILGSHRRPTLPRESSRYVHRSGRDRDARRSRAAQHERWTGSARPRTHASPPSHRSRLRARTHRHCETANTCMPHDHDGEHEQPRPAVIADTSRRDLARHPSAAGHRPPPPCARPRVFSGRGRGRRGATNRHGRRGPGGQRVSSSRRGRARREAE